MNELLFRVLIGAILFGLIPIHALFTSQPLWYLPLSILAGLLWYSYRTIYMARTYYDIGCIYLAELGLVSFVVYAFVVLGHQLLSD